MINFGGAYISKLDRYELKYLIPYELVEPISDYLKIYCTLDTHSRNSKDNFYIINSLYFDTPNFLFLKNRLYGKNPRFNLRARSYGMRPKAPYFLEIKIKQSNIVNKYRSMLKEEEWPTIFEDPSFDFEKYGDKKERANKELFYFTTVKYAATPKIFTQYRRRAFVSEIDEYARVTMDIDLKYSLRNSYDLIPKAKMIPYDEESVFFSNERTLGSRVVLELKCYPNQVPLWMLDMIRIFNLQLASFSKYLYSMRAASLYDPSYNEYYNFNDRIPV